MFFMMTFPAQRDEITGRIISPHPDRDDMVGIQDIVRPPGHAMRTAPVTGPGFPEENQFLLRFSASPAGVVIPPETF